MQPKLPHPSGPGTAPRWPHDAEWPAQGGPTRPNRCSRSPPQKKNPTILKHKRTSEWGLIALSPPMADTGPPHGFKIGPKGPRWPQDAPRKLREASKIAPVGSPPIGTPRNLQGATRNRGDAVCILFLSCGSGWKHRDSDSRLEGGFALVEKFTALPAPRRASLGLPKSPRFLLEYGTRNTSLGSM